MPKNYLLRVLMSKEQLHKIKQIADLKGYKTTSQYVRDTILEEDEITKRKIHESHEKLMTTV